MSSGHPRLVDRWVTSTTWGTAGAVVALAVLRAGIWAEPDTETLRQVARAPWSIDALAAAEFRARNWLGPLVSWCLRLTSSPGYFLLHLALAAMAALVWTAVVRRDCMPSDRGAVMLVVAALPGVALPFFWVGNDAVTLLLLASVVLLRKSATWMTALGMLLGFNHFEHGVVALGSLVIWGLLADRDQAHRIAAPVASLAGLVVGRLIQNAVFAAVGAAEVESRLGINLLDRSDFGSVKSVYFLLPLVAWSFLGLGTLVLLVASPERRRLAICLGMVAAPAVIAFDQTRVFAITAMPVTVVALIESATAVADWVRRHSRLLVASFIFVPWLWLDSWKISGSVTPYTLLWIVDRLVPGFELSTLPR